ncbi:MAG TPA: MBL fold metallo-hydrolase [Candidatus Tumulicola sp.]
MTRSISPASTAGSAVPVAKRKTERPARVSNPSVMNDETLPLEDTFGDDLRKAMIGNRIDAARLARSTGIDERSIAAWLKDDGVADDARARTLASALRLDPDKLADIAAGRWHPPPVERSNVRRHGQHPHPSNGYVTISADGRAALIDPAGRTENLLRVLSDGRYELDYVLITHKHADHCDAAAAVAQRYPQAQIVMHPLDVAALGPALAKRTRPLVDGEDLPFGKEGRIQALHTPGHTDGSACFLFDANLFTGDTLFAGSVGGAFGDRSTYGDILASIRGKIFTLPEATAIMPGHGPPTTVGLELQHNPFFAGDAAGPAG